MKDISEVTCCIVDAGTFVPLAEMMAGKCAKTFYYSCFEQEYLGIERCCIGDGMETFERVDDFMEPEFFDSVDLWMFPDIGFGGLQQYLRRVEKPVWGSMGASDLELYRTRFVRLVRECGLPVVKSVTIRGVSLLADHLKRVEDKWVKINRYRDNMETWHHLSWPYSQRVLENLALEFGPLKDEVIFVVQDCIKDEEESPALEVGYDGWFISPNGGGNPFPDSTFQGYEKKNQLYLGSLLPYDRLPEAVRMVNDRFADVLKDYGYRNFMATEIRIKDGVPYFIDPTMRMAGQTQEHLLSTCTNLPEIIWYGAHGLHVKPEFSHLFAAEATLHYTEGNDAWKTLIVPEEIGDKVKLYRCCYLDGAYHFPPHKSDELGVIIGQGDSVKSAIQDLNDAFAHFENAPVSIEADGFVDLVAQIETAEEEGVEFSKQQVPDPKSVIDA